MLKKALSGVRTLLRILTGKHLYIRPGIRKRNAWYGSHYGGFFVSPENLSGTSVVYSFGVGQDITFDLELIDKHKCSVYGFDPTPKSIKWISEQKLPSQFTFLSFGIAEKSGEVEFYLPGNEEYVSGSMLKNSAIDENRRIRVPMKSFSEITQSLGHRNIDLLKMDIEGAEYDVLPGIIASGVTIGQIVVEFHHKIIPDGRKKTKHIIALMKRNGYEIFAVSENAEEVSFIKKSRV